ncbi:MAG: AmmeMemoRadiSam system protein B [Candidatus Aminicenantes bacterium 4484_214]|nr:MAG: AmmeMemoRadiSam system protein B [Candidatus Aminicenantes bacterium 4484_214]RLE09585.1 MAG: AmmeMemoRadiSam system protein B [Candidatus Aminicenantes bacterium]
MRRKPAVAGYFYPSHSRELTRMIENYVESDQDKIKAKAVISPHAGYIYSGAVAGAVFSSVKLPERYLLLGPNHREVPTLMATYPDGSWETPLGELKIDSSLKKKIIDNCSLVEESEEAHAYEHSIEVQLPFIQYFCPAASIVPISISYYAHFTQIEELGQAIGEAVLTEKEPILIVASTDMSHYVPAETAQEKDNLAIRKVEELDAQGLIETVRKKNISMCGYLPTAVAIIAAKRMGAKKGELIKYQTSGDVSGDYSEVVGYAGIRIY